MQKIHAIGNHTANFAETLRNDGGLRVFYLIGGALRQCYNPPGGTPYNGLQVYERVNRSFGSVIGPKGLTCEFYGFIKSRKRST